MTLGRAAKNILRDYGEPMRVIDILAALHKAGHEEIKYPALNSILSRLARKGKLGHPEKGFYALGDEVVQQPRQLTEGTHHADSPLQQN
jgi:hypothetical protein